METTFLPFLSSTPGDKDKYDEIDLPDIPLFNSFSVFFYLGIGFILFGLILLAVSECRHRRLQKFYQRCMQEIIDAPSCLDLSNEGKLIYITGRLQVGSPVYLTDPELPIVAVSEALVLKRQVEMYQWVEKHTKVDSKYVYSYQLEWGGTSIGSKRFKNSEYQNPIWDMKFQNTTFQSYPEAYLGPYIMTKEIMRKIPMNEKMKLVDPSYTYSNINGFNIYTDDTFYYLTKKPIPEKYYTPALGDYRIKYYYLAVGANASIIGAQQGNSLAKFDGKVLIVENGIVSARNLLSRKVNNKNFRQYIIRIICAISLVIGFILAT